MMKVSCARPDLASTRQHPDVANLSRVGQKWGDLALDPGPAVTRSGRARPSRRLARMLSLAEADLDPHHGNLVLSEPSA